MKIYIMLCCLLSGAITMEAYQKVCFLNPQYGREGSIHEDLGHISREKAAAKPVYYTVEYPDGRKMCRVQLKRADANRVSLILNNYEDTSQITDSMVEQLMASKKSGLKTVGWVLRDFKLGNPNVTIQEVKSAFSEKPDHL